MEVVFYIMCITAGFTVGFFVRHMISQNQDDFSEKQKALEDQFKIIASDIAKTNREDFLKLANDKFDDKFNKLTSESDSQLEGKKKLIDENLDKMNKRLDLIQKQSSELNANIKLNKDETENLRDTTVKLREILSSSQKRGQWGERMVEDILTVIGLKEEINYKKQKQTSEGSRPDFTFFLPKEKVINMDVKFPLDHYERFIDTKDERAKENEKKDFLRDVKNHIKAISSRNYIDPNEGTLNYVLMFIPNESIYAFINQEDHTIIDEALKKKVLLCSPLTLYAMLSLIRQATENFVLEQQASKVIGLLGLFKKQWGLYVEQADKMGRSIDTVKRDYDNLVTTRKRGLDKQLDQIEDLETTIDTAEHKEIIENEDLLT